jgi:hypothetical protein
MSEASDESRKRKCCGTSEDSLIWCNSTDNAGLLFSTIVLLGILYAGVVTALVAAEGDMSIANTTIVLFLIFMSFWAQMKTMLGDPGTVPANAYPLPKDADVGQIVCGRCECYKPPNSHHGTNCISRNSIVIHSFVCIISDRKHAFSFIRSTDRVSKRCISRMDHFCPWMNNAIGAKNQKNFFLFLIYTDLASIYLYIVIVLHLVSLYVSYWRYTTIYAIIPQYSQSAYPFASS